MAQIILDSSNNLIQGDFDNATLNNRTKLQTTTTNATTNVYVVPNGSSTSAGVSVANNSSLTNASKIVMATNGTTDTQIISGVNGSGSYLPLSFYTNNALAAQLTTAGNLSVTGTVAGATGTLYPLVAGTAVASTSGTSIDFTSIPSWVERITVMFNGVSLSGTANPLIQIGTSGTPTTSGYVSSSSQLSSAVYIISSTAGYIIYSNSAGFVFSGVLTINNVSGNIWVASGTLANTAVAAATFTTAGTLTLGGALNMLRITTTNGTDTFDAGSVNILYE